MRMVTTEEALGVAGGEIAWLADIAGFGAAYGLDAAGLALGPATLIGIAFAESVQNNPGYFHSMPRQ